MSDRSRMYDEINTGRTKQDFIPNVRRDGRLWLAYCFACKKNNYPTAWETGQCVRCGYHDPQTKEMDL